MATQSRPRVVVLGGGFAGLGAARGLKDAQAELGDHPCACVRTDA
jgi:cation diffusion facilitator CzcD-associated flavoprotein CzcO